ncbi:MAG: Asp-tRNA(Asn)/Glu-tRNA(Gln) amidotransferase GatCAB subunit C [Rickettsiales bacterium]|nr:Asp-tRNA(Asn)/Glu-tRNA(Gln) amidotransferase GatCAB subunit C [Rickettsiales bacterium]
MALTTEEVAKIARLARIRIDEKEQEHFAKEISDILHWVEQLQEVDVEGVEQMTSVADLALPWRRDEVNDGSIQGEVLKNAPESEYGCFVVPKVIE